jgi:hypothetical protein
LVVYILGYGNMDNSASYPQFHSHYYYNVNNLLDYNKPEHKEHKEIKNLILIKLISGFSLFQ